MSHLWPILRTGALALAVAVALAQVSPEGRNLPTANGTIYVDADASGANNGASWGDAFTTLQPALNAATTGSQIWVAEGIYKPTVEYGGTGDRYKSFQLKKGVALYGGFDPSVGAIAFNQRNWEAYLTVVSGDIGSESEDSDNSYHVFYHPNGTDLDGTAILDGFVITGGNADGASPHYQGGGMYNSGSSPALKYCTFSNNSALTGGGMHNTNSSSPELTKCIFEDNEATNGGAMYSYYSSPVLIGCIMSGNTANYGGAMYNDYYSTPMITNSSFTGNSASYDGGGMYSTYDSEPTLADCAFSGNTANQDGGGMFNDSSSPTLTDCTFTDNSVASEGGGMHNDSASPTLTGCTFDGNAADYGGGMYNVNASAPTLASCAFEGNMAEMGGGGMYNGGSSPMLVNCTFTGNTTIGTGGGMRNGLDSSPVLTNCTFAGNVAGRGGGMYNWDSSPRLTNCILWGDAPGEIFNYDLASSPIVTYSDIQGSYAGEGNLAFDPRFVDPDNSDFHLGACSRCIDAGDNAAPSLPPYDFEGDSRILDGDDNGTATVDMGVDEVAVVTACFRVYLPLMIKGY